MKYLYTALWLLWATTVNLAAAQPYRPQHDSEILETLPAQGQAWLEIRHLRSAIAAAPNDMSVALQLVKRYIELGRAESDPRYYGYAEAVLNPWLKTAHPSAEALTLRATLYQNRHEFPAALENLNAALAQQPRLPQAWLTRALIQEVQGNYAAALNSCRPLLKLASPLTAQVCLNSTLSLSGQIETAYQQLQQAVQLAGAAPATDKQWALITLAEIAERKGDAVAAEHYYQLAFQLATRNGYLLATYADFLLDQQRYAEVVNLLQNEIRVDGLLLRLTMAEQQLNLASATVHAEALNARFAASRLRGDTVHQGDEARFLLHILHHPEPALALALANWVVQHEPRDARILLEAALCTGNSRQTAQPVLAFLAQAGVQDVRLEALIAQYKGGVS